MNVVAEVIVNRVHDAINPAIVGFENSRSLDKTELDIEVLSIGTYFRDKLEIGQYSELSSADSRRFLTDYLSQFDEATQARLRAAAITPWLIESYRMTQNIVDPGTPSSISNEPVIRDEVASAELFDSVLDVIGMMAKFKETSDPWTSFAGLEHSSLFARTGFLRVNSRDRSDSVYQQANLVLLGMRGLDVQQLDNLFDYVQYEKVSRGKMGKTPAGMSIALANNMPERNEDVEMLRKRIAYGWGTPPGPGESIEENIVCTRAESEAAYAALFRAIEAGTYVSDRYLAMVDKSMIKNLIYLRQEVQLAKSNNGWNRPLWWDPNTEIVYDHNQKIIIMPKKKNRDIVKSDERPQESILLNTFRGLLGILKTSKL